jgi:hypothetical protein
MQTRRTFLAETGALAVSAQTAEQTPRRNMLAGAWPPERLARTLVPAGQWEPFPTAADRAAWQGMPAQLVDAGARGLGAEWPTLPATLFLEFARIGNRSNYEAVWRRRRNRLRDLTVAECVEGQGRFIDEIVNGIWTVCEETFWGYPAHLNLQKKRGLPDVTEPVIDLFAAETGAQLAWTHYLLGPQIEKVNPLVPERIRVEMERRILAPYRSREDWGWMGLSHTNPVNNWNPWINSNVLACALLFEPEATRAQFVHKLLRSLDRFLDSYHEDGGCDEGPGYWGRAGASLFDNLELLHSASGGAIDYYSAPLVREIGRYIYRAHISDDWFVNFADASAKPGIPGDLVFRYGQRIADEDMQAFGAWDVSRGKFARADSLGRMLPALFNKAIRDARGRQPLVRDVWLPGIQVMAARQKAGSPEGLYLAAQGGHNAESHNHNDVGNFMVFSGGQPAIVDAGVETYSAKTFGPRRYEIWTMQSSYHNRPEINGVMQGAGRQFAARDVSYKDGEFSLDIAGAYPPEAGVRSWRRTLRLDRAKNEIEVRDRYVLAKAGGRVAMTLMTPCEVAVENGRLRLADRASVLFDARALEPEVETIRIEDGRLKPVWGERLFRIRLRAGNVPAEGEFTLRIVPS